MSNQRPVADSWKFCPLCGASHATGGINPFRCHACGHIHHFSPVTAVAAIVNDAAGNILLLVRANDPGRGKLGLPGGFVDPGESAEDALRREVLEEVGLHVTRLNFLLSLPNRYAFGGVILPVTDLFFVAEVASFDNMIAQQGEIDDWHFCQPGPEELNKMAFESNRQALEVFLQRRKQVSSK